MMPVAARMRHAVPRSPRFASVALTARLALARSRSGAGARGRLRCAGRSLPGLGRRPCPYAAAQIIGQRAEGVLRFPEAVARRRPGQRVRRRPAELRRAEVQRRGRVRGRVGLVRRRPRPVRSDRRARDRRARATCTCVDSEPQPDPEVRPERRTSSRPGAGAAARSASSASAPRRTPRSHRAAGSRSSGNYVYVADSGNNRDRALQPRRRRSDRSGAPTGAAPASSPTRAAWRPTKAR